MCSRCVRFTREISGTAELQVINRGDHAEIDIFPGEPLENKLAGNVVDLCPVGALGSKDFLYKQRVWYLKTTDERLPRLPHRVQHPRRRQQGHRLSACGRGRTRRPRATSCATRAASAITTSTRDERIMRPLDAGDGSCKPTPWATLITPELQQRFADAAQANAAASLARAVAVPDLRGSVPARRRTSRACRRTCGSCSGRCRSSARTTPIRRTAAGQPGRAGEVHDPGREVPESPRRRGGAEALPGRSDSVRECVSGRRRRQRSGSPAAIRTGHVNRAADELARAAAARRAGPVPSPVTATATFVLPATSRFEKDGTFVNHAGLAQAFARAVRPPQEVRTRRATGLRPARPPRPGPTRRRCGTNWRRRCRTSRRLTGTGRNWGTATLRHSATRLAKDTD